jgi:hypothetical protein
MEQIYFLLGIRQLTDGEKKFSFSLNVLHRFGLKTVLIGFESIVGTGALSFC